MSDIPALLSSDDLASFAASDPDWFLEAAGEMVRWSICQWHIAPSITQTLLCPVKPDGTIELPSLHVTDVQSVSIHGLELDPNSYHWRESGHILRHQQNYFEWPLWPLESDKPFREYPSPLALRAEVTFTHGFDELPAVVREVAFEIAKRAMEMPSGIAKDITAGPYSIRLGALGVVPTEDDRRALGPWTLRRF